MPPPFLTSALDAGKWSASRPCRLSGPQSRSGRCGEEKNRALPGMKPGQSSP
jgi:hypothetical protein